MTAPYWKGAERCLSITDSEEILLMEREKNVCSLNTFILITKQATGFQDKNGDVRNRVEQSTFNGIWCCLRQTLLYCPPNLTCNRAPPPHTQMPQAGMDVALLLCNSLCCCWPPLQERLHTCASVKGFSYSIMCKSLTWIRYFELRVTETPAPQAQTARLATNRHLICKPGATGCLHQNVSAINI